MSNPEKENLKKKLLNTQSDFARYSVVGFKMLAIIGIGTYGGFLLDQKYPNNYSGFTVALSLLSVFGALYSIIKDLTGK